MIGGDTRYVEIIRLLSQLKARIFLVGFHQLTLENGSVQRVSIEETDQSQFDAIILPITGISRDGKMTSYFSDKPICIAPDFFQSLKDSCQIFSGVRTEFLTDLEKEQNLSITYLFEKDEVAIRNAIPTAEGLLLLTIQNTDVTIHGARVLILGFGRLGQTLARVYHHLGSKVTVVAREAANRARAKEIGVEAVSMDDMITMLPEADICINTIPAQILTEERLYHFKHHVLLIDAASRPGGVDLNYAEQRGLQIMLAPSLPGLVAPKTAGKILAESIIDQLSHDKLD